MAYVLPRQDEEEQQQNQQTPLKLGGSSLAPAPSSSGTPQQQQQTQQSQNAQFRGTGFTNLQNYLDAGKGRHQNIAQTGQNLLGQEKTAFDTAANPLRTATYSAKTVADVNKTGGDVFGQNLWKAATGDQQAKSDITGMLDQKYEGPRDVAYNPHAQKNLWDTASLSSTNTIGNVLARPAIEQGQYGAGMRRLDNLLYGADAASRQASTDVGKQLGDFTKTVSSEKEKLGEKVAGFDKAADEASAGTRAEIERQGQNWLADLDRDVAKKRDKEAKDRSAAEKGLVYNPKSGRYERLAPGQTIGEISGATATRENVASDTQRKGFDLLNELIGTPKLGQAGPYQRPTVEVLTAPPVEPEAAPVSKEYVDKFNDLLSQTLDYKNKGGAAGFDVANNRLWDMARSMTRDQWVYLHDQWKDNVRKQMGGTLTEEQLKPIMDNIDGQIRMYDELKARNAI